MKNERGKKAAQNPHLTFRDESHRCAAKRASFVIVTSLQRAKKCLLRIQLMIPATRRCAPHVHKTNSFSYSSSLLFPVGRFFIRTSQSRQQRSEQQQARARQRWEKWRCSPRCENTQASSLTLNPRMSSTAAGRSKHTKIRRKNRRETVKWVWWKSDTQIAVAVGVHCFISPSPKWHYVHPISRPRKNLPTWNKTTLTDGGWRRWWWVRATDSWRSSWGVGGKFIRLDDYYVCWHRKNISHGFRLFFSVKLSCDVIQQARGEEKKIDEQQTRQTKNNNIG